MTSSEYVARHNIALMVLAVYREKKYNLLGKDVELYSENWKRRHVMKMCTKKKCSIFNLIYEGKNIEKTDMVLEDKEKKND